ncbi:hypothetical protein ACLUWM_01390 [Limosilactobacillus mucosae]
MNEYPLLPPSYMLAAMKHDQTFQHAVALLHDDWDPNEGGLFREMLQVADIKMARALQKAGMIKGSWQLDDYGQVKDLLALHAEWFSPAARNTLLAPFE